MRELVREIQSEDWRSVCYSKNREMSTGQSQFKITTVQLLTFCRIGTFLHHSQFGENEGMKVTGGVKLNIFRKWKKKRKQKETKRRVLQNRGLELKTREEYSNKETGKNRTVDGYGGITGGRTNCDDDEDQEECEDWSNKETNKTNDKTEGRIWKKHRDTQKNVEHKER